jgi:hypothetical protein
VKAFVATVAIAVLALAGCGDDGGGDSGGTDGTDAAPELSSYETVSDLNDALASGGVECNLEYEGLTDDTHEISQCTIDGGQAILTVWYDDSLLQEFVAPEGVDPPEAVAYGDNWTVEASTPETAATVAEAAGGTTTDG